jgi:hypothetical protein
MNGRYTSTFEGRGGGPTPRQSGLRQYPPHHAVMDVQLTRDGAHHPLLGVTEAQDLCLDLRAATADGAARRNARLAFF